MRGFWAIVASAALGAVSFVQLAFAQASTAPVLRPLKTEAVWMRDCLRANNSDAEVCTLDWSAIGGAGATADALLALVPERAGVTFNAAGLRTRAPQIQWTARPAASGAGATGTIRNPYIQDEVRVSANFDRIMFAHPTDENEPDFYFLKQALELRGARVTMLGCDVRPGQLHMNAMAVAAPGRLPFTLVEVATYTGNPPAVAHVADLSSAPPTLQRASALFQNARWGRCATQ